MAGETNGSTGARDLPSLMRMVELLASRQASSRADLTRLTGLSPSTVSQRVDTLLRCGLLIEVGNGTSTRGRRPVLLSLNRAAGVLLGADLGASHFELGIADLDARIFKMRLGPIDIATGPEAVLTQVTTEFRQMLDEEGLSPQDVRAIGIGLPGPVDFERGMAVRPPIMPGWDGFSVPAWFMERFEARAVVDNDVNVMALGAYWSGQFSSEHMLVVKVATGIGCGIITGGKLHRGADGAAGDIGHIRVAGVDVTCPCGNRGCLEAVASASAVARQLRLEGMAIEDTDELVRMARAGEPRVLIAVRAAGQQIGEVLASLVNFYNPDTVVIGGALAELRDELLAVVRGVIYQRALPLATRALTIAASTTAQHACLSGAAILARQAALDADSVASWVSNPSIDQGAAAGLAAGALGTTMS